MSLQNLFLDNYQSVAIMDKKVVIGFGDNFAPGVWSGTEGTKLEYMGDSFRIVKVDFDRHLLECFLLPKLGVQ